MAQTKLYFAYGSNMDLEQMKFRCPHAKPLRPAKLKNYDFIINPRGVASIVPSPGQDVEGLLWEITDDCEASLDVYEGITSKHYEKKHIELEGLKEEAVLVYVATSQDRAFRPRDGYFEKILRAARAAGLSERYVESLQKYFDECNC